MAAGKGPAISIDKPDRRDTELTASLRIISIYDPQTDGILTRLDVLLNHTAAGKDIPFRHGMIGDQVNKAFRTTAPGVSDMLVPKSGIVGAYTFKASPEDLSRAFRDLADVIDDLAKKPGAEAA